jgi:hypothetical protein
MAAHTNTTLFRHRWKIPNPEQHALQYADSNTFINEQVWTRLLKFPLPSLLLLTMPDLFWSFRIDTNLAMVLF